MLEKPDLNEEEFVACLQNEYQLSIAKLGFLALGADENTAVYRVVTKSQEEYFLKLRKGDLDESVILVPEYLSEIGTNQIIPIFKTKSGKIWASFNSFKVFLYPYIDGHNAYEVKMSKKQWIEYGTALKNFHAVEMPLEITDGIRRESFSSHWRDTVRFHLEQIKRKKFSEPAAKELASFLHSKSDETIDLVSRADRLGKILIDQPPEHIVCHGDIHGWNILIDTNGKLFMVDWDTLIIAPKERDLMFVGGGLGDSGYTPQQEEAMFYQGYGKTEINQIAISYYRYERIVEDIAIYCDQILLSDKGGQDREQSLRYLKSNYNANSTIEISRKMDRTTIN